MKEYLLEIQSGYIRIFEGVADDIIIDHIPNEGYYKDRAFYSKADAKGLIKRLMKLVK